MSTYEFGTKHINTHCSRNSFDKAILPTVMLHVPTYVNDRDRPEIRPNTGYPAKT